MNEEVAEEIRRRVTALRIGETFFLKALLADLWDGLGDGFQRRSIGIAFAKAVTNGEFPECEPTEPLGRIRDVRYVRIIPRR